MACRASSRRCARGGNRCAHAGLALSIGLGALLNAGWLLVGLLRRGTYRPGPGWWRFVLQVVAASAVLAIYLLWASTGLAWLAVPGGGGARVLQLLLVLGGAVTLYFVVLLLGGVKLREFVRK